MSAFWKLASLTLRQARRLVFFVVGMTVVLFGIVMIVTPGPAILVVPLGLGILAVEFAWARRLLRRIKLQIRRTRRKRGVRRTTTARREDRIPPA